MNSDKTWWKVLQSWWIILAFIPAFHWLAFVYISIRGRDLLWAIWALAYATPVAAHYFIPHEVGSWSDHASAALFLLAWLSAILHSIWVNRIFLSRLQNRKTLEKRVAEIFREQYENDSDRPASPFELRDPARETRNIIRNSNYTRLELNTATEEQIAALPGVGIILAQKAVQIRQIRGSFMNFDEFCSALELKPHVVEKIGPLTTVTRLSPPVPGPNFEAEG